MRRCESCPLYDVNVDKRAWAGVFVEQLELIDDGPIAVDLDWFDVVESGLDDQEAQSVLNCLGRRAIGEVCDAAEQLAVSDN